MNRAEVWHLPETNIAHENRPSQKECSLPTIHFQVGTVSFREGSSVRNGIPHWTFHLSGTCQNHWYFGLLNMWVPLAGSMKKSLPTKLLSIYSVYCSYRRVTDHKTYGGTWIWCRVTHYLLMYQWIRDLTLQTLAKTARWPRVPGSLLYKLNDILPSYSGIIS